MSARLRVEQVWTVAVSSARIMKHPAFVRGFDDKRAGRPFDANQVTDIDTLWSYERGRLLGCIMPLSMPLFINGRLNPKAIALFVLDP